MSSLGFGVMIVMLFGGSESAEALKSAAGKTIASIEMRDNEKLDITLSDGDILTIWDNGQSCCEHRYMSSDDKPDDFIGATLIDIEVASADGVPTDGEEHEIQFLRIMTSRGVYVVSNHNEHNGYYGGFWLAADLRHPVQPMEATADERS